MYTHLRARTSADGDYQWDGYIYDISESGIRFELDDAIEPGTNLDVHITLPGKFNAEFDVTGEVVRMHDEDDEPGPRRMAMTFKRFDQPTDQQKLSDYLIHHCQVA